MNACRTLAALASHLAVPATAAAAALALVACGATGAGIPPAPGGFLVKAPSVTPTFPLTATYLPPGVVRPAFLGFDDDMLTARFKIAGTARDVADNFQGLDIEIDTDPDDSDPRAELTDVMDPGIVTEVQVQGQQAWLSVSRDAATYTTVAWLRTSKELVTVAGPFSGETVIRVAEGLRNRPEPARADFTVALAPAGFQLSGFGEQEIVLAPRHATRGNSVDVQAEDSDPDPTSDDNDLDTTSKGGGRQVTIGTRSGWLRKEDGRFHLTLHLKETYWLVIDTPATGRWTEQELRRFAAGVDYIGPEPPRGV